MPELRGLVDDPEPGQLGRPCGDGVAHLDHVVDVALRVRPPRDREADEVERRGPLGPVGVQAEHHRADLASADAPRLVERDGERLARVLERRDVREQRPCVEVHGVPADGMHDRELPRERAPAPR